MSEQTLQAQLPTLPETSFFTDPERSIMTSDARALLSYDPQTRAGFVYVIDKRQWFISAPIEFPDFARICAHSGYTIGSSDDAKRWLRVCSAALARKMN